MPFCSMPMQSSETKDDDEDEHENEDENGDEEWRIRGRNCGQ